MVFGNLASEGFVVVWGLLIPDAVFGAIRVRGAEVPFESLTLIAILL